MCYRYFQFLTIGLIIFGLAGCRGDSPVAPDELAINAGVSANNYASNHYLWGLWDVSIDPNMGAIETIPLRTADFNANVVRFLQPPISPIHMLTIALGPGCEPTTGYWVIDVTLKHPFPSMDIFRGFDVRGIIMTEGDAVGIHDTTVRYSGLGGTRLLNPDGFTRWWNMQEFTSYGKIFGYTEGAFSTPGFNATATVNPYKLFTDALDLESPVSSMVPELRASFWTQSGPHTRRYEMQFDIDGGTPPIRFKYAVDASWSLPDPQFAPEYPINAYDLSANCQEPYLVDVPIFIERPYYENATSFGGDAVFRLTIGDWQATSAENVIDQISHIWVESPTLIDAPIDVLSGMEFVESTHATQATYRVTIPDCQPTGLEDQYFLITVESAYPDSYIPQIQGDPYAFAWPDAKLAAYAVVEVPVSPTAPYMNFGWAKHAGGTENDKGQAITTLSDDSVVITDCYGEVAIFGEGEPNETILTGDNNVYFFIARYNPDGTLEWVKGAGGSGWDNAHGLGIAALSDDSTVVIGWFTDVIVFAKGEPNETVLGTDGGGSQVFIARFNPDGSLAWAILPGLFPEGDDYRNYGIAGLTDDSFVITGGFHGTIKLGEGEPNETVLHAEYTDILVAKYNSNGALIWAKSAGGEHHDMGVDVTTLSDSSIIVCGGFEWSATFGKGEPNETVLVSYAFSDVFIARYNPDGTLDWAVGASGPEGESGIGITTLANSTIAVTGVFKSQITFGEGEPTQTTLIGNDIEIFLAKYNPDGSFVWAKSAGGMHADWCHDIAPLSDGEMVLTGYFGGEAVFGKGEPKETALVSEGCWDMFIARYGQDGMLTWARSAGGTGGVGGGEGRGITALSDDSAIVTGIIGETVIFGKGEPNETVLESYGDLDIFIARYYP